MDEDTIELAPQPDRTHVALDMLALRVQRAAHLEHAWSAVDEHHVESCFQIRRIIAAPAAQFQQRLRGSFTRTQQQSLIERCLLFGTRQERTSTATSPTARDTASGCLLLHQFHCAPRLCWSCSLPIIRKAPPSNDAACECGSAKGLRRVVIAKVRRC